MGTKELLCTISAFILIGFLISEFVSCEKATRLKKAECIIKSDNGDKCSRIM